LGGKLTKLGYRIRNPEKPRKHRNETNDSNDLLWRKREYVGAVVVKTITRFVGVGARYCRYACL